MAKRHKTRTNRFLMMRTPGLSHPFLQRINSGVFAVASRAWQDSFGSIRFAYGSTTGLSQVTVCFNTVPVGSTTLGVTINLDSVAANITGSNIVGSCIVYDLAETMDDTTDVEWIYDSGVGNLADAKDNPLESGTHPISNTLDTTAPTLVSVEVLASGTTVEITFDEPVVNNTGFTFTVDAVGQLLTSPVNAGNKIQFTTDLILNGQTCLLSYVAGDVEDSSGNALANFTDAAVTNNSQEFPDITPPELVLADIDASGVKLNLLFDESVTGNTGFSLTADGDPKALSGPGGSGDVISFTTEPVLQGQTGLVSYSAGDVEDLSGNPLATIVDGPVLNQSTLVAPTLQTAVVDAAGTLLTLTFSETVTGNVGFTLTADASPIGLSVPGGSGDTITFTTDLILLDQVCLLSYAPGDVVDADSIPLAAFTDTAVTNNSTQEASLPDFFAMTYNPATMEVDHLRVGTGAIDATHTATIYQRAYDGLYYSFAEDEPVLRNGRFSGGTWYADGNNDGVPTVMWACQKAMTNSQVQSNDQSNAAWSKARVTVAQDEVGLTGAANTACTITATSPNGEVLGGAITRASATQTTKWYIKRKTGTGTVELTVDGGVTWQDVTSQITTSDFTEILVDQAAVTDPEIGVNLVTSGDAVIVGNAECHLAVDAWKMRYGGPIFTTTAAASTDNVHPVYDAANDNQNTGLYYIEVFYPHDMALYGITGASAMANTNSNLGLMQARPNASTAFRSSDGTAASTAASQWPTLDDFSKVSVTYGTTENKRIMCLDGVYGVEVGYDGTFFGTAGSVAIGAPGSQPYTLFTRNLQRFTLNYADARTKNDELMA